MLLQLLRLLPPPHTLSHAPLPHACSSTYSWFPKSSLHPEAAVEWLYSSNRNSLECHLKRNSLVISSAHGKRPFRLGVVIQLGDQVTTLLSRMFRVLEKRPKRDADPTKQLALRLEAPVPEDDQRSFALSHIRAAFKSMEGRARGELRAGQRPPHTAVPSELDDVPTTGKRKRGVTNRSELNEMAKEALAHLKPNPLAIDLTDVLVHCAPADAVASGNSPIVSSGVPASLAAPAPAASAAAAATAPIIMAHNRSTRSSAAQHAAAQAASSSSAPVIPPTPSSAASASKPESSLRSSSAVSHSAESVGSPGMHGEADIEHASALMSISKTSSATEIPPPPTEALGLTHRFISTSSIGGDSVLNYAPLTSQVTAASGWANRHSEPKLTVSEALKAQAGHAVPPTFGDYGVPPDVPVSQQFSNQSMASMVDSKSWQATGGSHTEAHSVFGGWPQLPELSAFGGRELSHAGTVNGSPNLQGQRMLSLGQAPPFQALNKMQSTVPSAGADGDQV